MRKNEFEREKGDEKSKLSKKERGEVKTREEKKRKEKGEERNEMIDSEGD
jgi:hypothetical protein